MRIFLTGATGFLGSHLAQYLSERGHELLCMKRTTSNYKKNIKDVTWINSDIQNWKSIVSIFNPETVIHAAWIGVSAQDRIDEKIQRKNLTFTDDILEASKQCKRFIGLGSQDEYGFIDKVINETHPTHPTSYYGKTKLDCLQKIQDFCSKKNIDWYWLRLFSIYGEGNKNSIIQNTILKILNGDSYMDTSIGKQQYAFLYILDFCYAINAIITHNGDCGVYNLSSEYAITIKDVLLKIRDKLNPNFILNFGAVPCRTNQSMVVQGDSHKFINVFGKFEKETIDSGLSKYYTNILNYE